MIILYLTQIIIILAHLIICQGASDIWLDKLISFRSHVQLTVQAINEISKVQNELLVKHDLKHIYYVGNNKHLYALINNSWNVYYECLKAQSNLFGVRSSMSIQSKLGLSESQVRFECDLCLSPRDLMSPPVWFYAPNITSDIEYPVDTSPTAVVSETDFSLSLYGLDVTTHTGLYHCQLGSTSSVPIWLEVRSEEPLDLIRFSSPSRRFQVFSRGLIAETVWSDWTSCSACGKVGIKSQTGICTIGPLELHHNEPEFQIFSVFKEGLPCRSKLLDKSIRSLIASRPSEIRFGFCLVTCPSTIFVATDGTGNVIEVANNSLGVYSQRQGIPLTPTPVGRRTIFADINSRIVISCPGFRYSTAPFEWKKYSNESTSPLILHSFLYKDAPVERVWVDERNRLNFQNVLYCDHGIFLCLQEGEIAGVVRLIPFDPMEQRINSHFILYVITIISVIFFLITATLRRVKLHNIYEKLYKLIA